MKRINTNTRFGLMHALLALIATFLTVHTSAGQLSNMVVAGYGSATFDASPDSDFRNGFTASFSPVFLSSVGKNMLFEAELEFGLSGEATTTSLEYAQVDYLGFERVQLIAGKFLVPFGLFGARLHPTWINKMPTAPPIYGHAHGGASGSALLPILSDAGFMARYKAPVSKSWAFDVSAWISQGPVLIQEEAPDPAEDVDDGHGHKSGLSSSDDHHETESAINIPSIGFGVAFSDNNSNKMLGARLGLVHVPSFEVYVSGFHAMYDPEEYLDIMGFNLAADWRRGGFDFRAEGILIRQEFEHNGGFETMSRTGYYLQAAKRKGRFEPVVRWSHLLESTVDGQIAKPEMRQLAIGVNYWIEPSVPVKLAYQIGLDGEDLVLLQWAFGF